jgi:hypothetical protein
MSFWTNNLCVPTWTEFFQSYFYSRPAKLIDPRPAAKAIQPFPRYSGLSMRRATAEDIVQLPGLWSRWFSTSKSARCVVPLAHIQKYVESGKWDILVCVKDGIEVVGTLVCRLIEGLHMREVRWPKAFFIDYLCTHPAYRNKGVCRSLMTLIHNMTTDVGILPPTLCMWEGIHPSIPPISVGLYAYKKCSPMVGFQAEKLEGMAAEQAWVELQRGNQVWSEYSPSAEETSVWSSISGSVAIWNTFHRSVPEGLLIGIVVGGGSTAAVDAFSSASGHPFGILLATWPFRIHSLYGLEGWNIDSPYQWISYNTHAGFINTQFPGLCL